MRPIGRNRITTTRRAGRSVALGCITGLVVMIVSGPAPALAGLSNATGSTANSTCVGVNSAAGFCGYEQSFKTNNATTIESRYAWNINADVGVGSNRFTDGTATHGLSFDASAPGGYRLDVTTRAIGAMGVIDDAGGCAGIADVSAFTGTASPALYDGTMNHDDPGFETDEGGLDQHDYTPVNSTKTARIFGVSNGSARHHDLTMTWSGHVRSHSCATAVLLGLQNDTTTNCGVCDYPRPDGSLATDGQYIKVTFTSLCGNGVVDAEVGEVCDQGNLNGTGSGSCTTTCQGLTNTCGNGVVEAFEQCDLGTGNGSSASCCTASCQFKSAGSSCSDGLFCDGTELCDATGSCAFSVNIPCSGSDGDASCANRCDEATDTCTLPDPAGSGCGVTPNQCESVACDGGSTAYLGFTAATGGATSNHDILDWTVAGTGISITNFAQAMETGDCNYEPICMSGPSTDFTGTALRLTSDTGGSQIGAVFTSQPIDVQPTFDTTFHYRISGSGVHGDGFAFVIQNSPAGRGAVSSSAGGSLGYAGIVHSLAVEFDTFNNGGEPAVPFVSVQSNGTLGNTSSHTSSLGSFSYPSMTDGAVHSARIVYESGTLSIYLDGATAPNMSVATNLQAIGLGAATCATGDRPNGAACNDLLFCNGSDFCAGGECQGHSSPPCSGPDQDGNCSESCDETTDSCGAPDPDGTSCADSSFCNGVDTCSGGACVHSGNPCPGPDGDENCAESCDDLTGSCTAVDPPGSACNDGLFCNGVDHCFADTCGFHSNEPCAGPDGDADCSETCDEATDDCTAPDPAGSLCPEDSNPCTVAQCDGLGSCAHPPGNLGDSCRPAAGECDVEELCDGVSASCPADVKSTTTCREAGDQCDVAEMCDGVSDECPADEAAPEGTTCSDGDSCTTNDVCTDGVCDPGDFDLATCGEDFLCYKTKAAGKFTPINGVLLEDRWGAGSFDVIKTGSLCTPASVDGDAVGDAATRLVRYLLKAAAGAPKYERELAVPVTNELGSIHLDTVKPDSILVPAAMDLNAPPAAPASDAHDVDAYKCYRAKVARGTTPFPKGIHVTVGDEFTNPGTTRVFDLLKPSRVCRAVRVNDVVPNDVNASLLCYRAKKAKGEPKHVSRDPVYTADQLRALVLKTVKEEELCIPSSIDDQP